MNHSEKYQNLMGLLTSLVNDRDVKKEIPSCLESDEEFRSLYASLLELRQALFALSKGDLNYSIRSRGYLLGELKGLQADLRHLTWQTKAIASGDFTQRVDFMGEFSESFNSMTKALDSAIKELKKSEEKYRLLTEYPSDVIWVLNLNTNRFSYISPSVYSLRGFTAEEAMEERLEDALTPESLDLIQRVLPTALNEFFENQDTPKYYIEEVQQPCKNGDIIWTEVSTRIRSNSDGEIEMVGVSRSIEKRKKTERQVLYLSYHDQLTGLNNRRFYEEELQRLDIEENLPITLISADVNGLKLTNDAFGHLAGDNLLKSFSEILKSNSRQGDIAARIGGDEFVLFLPKTNAEQAEKIVDCIQSSIAMVTLENTILSVSFGISTKYNINEDLDKIFMQAENKMYHKKLLESRSLKNETIKLINTSFNERNAREQQHCERVSNLCMDIGMALGLSSGTVDELGLLGLFHDIGKIGINEKVLNKCEGLNENEMDEMKRHPEIGYRILGSINEFTSIAEYVLSHHERIDGNGYPRRLKEAQIPLQSKILSIAEAYDVMTNDYPYKAKVTVEAAINELEVNSSTQFDAEIVKVFVENVLRKKVTA